MLLRLVALVLLVAAGAPSAAASDPFADKVCVDAFCVGPGTCTPYGCVPRSFSTVAPTVEAGVSTFAADAGTLSAGVYRSDIMTEGARGGLFGQLAPSENHTWTQLSVILVYTGGSGEDLQVSLWLLDNVPDGCHVRSPSGSGPNLDCPRIHELLP